MLTKTKKNRKNLKIENFENIYHKFLFPRDKLIYHKVWLRSDENWRSSVLKFFYPIGSHVNENEKKNRKNLKIENFEKRNWSGDLVERELPTKFGLDPCSGFWETWDGRLTTDACAMTAALLTKSSRAKNYSWNSLNKPYIFVQR